MKIFYCTCVAFLLHGQNLLLNPGFENWNGGVPDHWICDSGIVLFQESGIVYEGSYSARESLYTQLQSDADLLQGRFSVQPNIRYTFSMRVYDDDPAGQVRQAVYWYPDGSAWSSVYSDDTTIWQQLVLDVLSPPDAESALVMIRAYDIANNWDGDAIFYLDAAEFRASDIQPPLVLRSWHIPMNPGPDTGITVYAWVTDNGSIVADTLFFGVNDLSIVYELTHTTMYNDTCVFHIPEQNSGDTVFYFMKFVDDDGLTCFSDTAACYIGEVGLYLNELYYDASGTDTSCFIELYRAQGGSLDGFSIAGISGSSGTVYVTIDLDGCSIPPDGFFVIAQDPSVPNADTVTGNANLQNGPDNIEIRYHGIPVDALGYGTLDGWHFTGEWLPASDVSSGHALGRYPDGHDTDNNYVDFHDYTVRTPGTPNPYVSVREAAVPQPCLKPAGACVISGMPCSMVTADRDEYPITAYNSTGQRVMYIQHPGRRVLLPAGVYFLRFNRSNRRLMKLVVVK